jgi:hypothetical protein
MSNLSEFDDSASTTSTTHSDFGGADGFGGICDLLRRCPLSALLRAMPLARRPRGLQQPRLARGWLESARLRLCMRSRPSAIGSQPRPRPACAWLGT